MINVTNFQRQQIPPRIFQATALMSALHRAAILMNPRRKNRAHQCQQPNSLSPQPHHSGNFSGGNTKQPPRTHAAAPPSTNGSLLDGLGLGEHDVPLHDGVVLQTTNRSTQTQNDRVRPSRRGCAAVRAGAPTAGQPHALTFRRESLPSTFRGFLVVV
jgi:hypothetical protein